MLLLLLGGCGSSIHGAPASSSPPECPPPPVVAVTPPPPPFTPSVSIDCGDCLAPRATLGVLPATAGGGATIAIELVAPPASQPEDGPWTFPCLAEFKRGGTWSCKPRFSPVYCEGGAADGGEKDGCLVTASVVDGDQAAALTLIKHVADPLPATMTVELGWALCNKQVCRRSKATATLQLR